LKKPHFKSYSNRQLIFYTKRAVYILFAWVLVSNIFFFYEFYTLKSQNALTSEFDLQTSFVANLIVSSLAGLIGGIFTVNLMERWLRGHVFWKALTAIIAVYLVAAFVVSGIGAAYFYTDFIGHPVTHPEVISAIKEFFGTFLFLKNLILWLIIVIVTLIILMVNDKYGPGVFPDYLLGKYFMPKQERRIFMFADIKNATGIAEDLGEERYFNFLKDFFRDIAPAIVQTRGEVYQYVGDEVVISWKMKNGLKKGNAIQCFYSMKKILRYRHSRYLKIYGYKPEFKVGFHFGDVMVGEIGQIKRDIAFTGDVLNTTARIQSLCNELGVAILVSEDFAKIATSLPKGIEKVAVGAEVLKGKAEKMELYTFKRKK
jgi:adenylate cyclase